MFTPSIATAGDGAALVLFGIVAGICAGFCEELGWSGFALPRLLDRHGVLTSGLLLGVPWGLWHLLADYWGNAEPWGGLVAARFLLWAIASFTAFRILIIWAYAHTGSLLLAQLMHASFVAAQVPLGTATGPSLAALGWYGAFAATLWLVVAPMLVLERRRTTSPWRGSAAAIAALTSRPRRHVGGSNSATQSWRETRPADPVTQIR